MTALEMDAADPLAAFVAEFSIPPTTLYLDGNSLGLLSRPAEDAVWEAVDMWRTLAVRGWTEGPAPWFGLSRRAAAALAPLLGADPHSVFVGQSATANLHQLLATFATHPNPNVLLDATHFPTDRYAVDSFQKLRGRGEVVLVQPRADRLLHEDDIIAALAGVGFAVLPAVVYTTGQLLDLSRIDAAARALGVRVAWDCSHSAGAVPHTFAADGVRLAFGCGYKYLNGSPGAVGWGYVAPELLDTPPGLAGWFGSDPARQFEMSATFHPAADADRFQLGTPHVLSLAPLVGALDVLRRAGMDRVREKSLRLTAYLRHEVETRLTRFGVTVVTPPEDHRRGGHVTLSHPHAGPLSRALRAANVVPDFRRPDLLRLAPAPLTSTFADVQLAVAVIEQLLTDESYRQFEATDVVT